MKIKETDLINGKMYLSLLNDYKVYDKKQKAVIKALNKKIVSLEARIKEIADNKNVGKILIKELKQRTEIESLNETIKKLKKENEKLFHENILLKNQ